MNPKIEELANVTAVKAKLGDPIRFTSFGMAPQDGPRPYATWQTISGQPENYLGQVPDMDGWEVQVDTFAKVASAAREAATALRDAFEAGGAVITAYNGESRDPDTKDYRITFTVGHFVSR